MKASIARVVGNVRHPLAPRWRHGEEVTVVGFDQGYGRVLGDGKETAVFIVNMISGRKGYTDTRCQPC